ncbi:isoleucyl-tRNA synthetase [Aciduliprofundum sp. MAR08-339]|uniref:isoleucine--tRNA ligase n=1 Tax=Aciduliprofundum sp. (strain MAR08-339) TaxID=673860 RepID=UPI0002A4BE4B|nr:isoleucyl-tRNA synthetase [Aciduliprofundum sp. MAR08-339]
MEIKSIRDFPKLEERILDDWERNNIFEKLRMKNRGNERFIFLEGPPTANGMPHIGHALTRAVKDLILRYKAMNGYDVEPWIGGWDCHGLPVEIEVEKKLGINSKKEIEKYGIKRFNKLCKESVFKYRDEWIKMTKRIGFWIDMDNAYVTMENYYIESVWWALKKIYEKGLLVKDYKVVPYCPRCGTPLSSHEVAQGYKETKDPSVYVKFKVADEDAYFLVWTTTPWTLPSNLLLAVGKDIDYALVEYEGEKYYIAKARIPAVLGEARIIREMKGSELIGKRYERLIPFVPVDFDAFYVTWGDFVSTEDGTGIVHIAPAFGEDDYLVCKREGVPLIKPVNEEGRFTDTPWKGKFVKDADPEIMAWLKEQGKLFKKGTVKHTYPFCWRCGTPLLYYALDTWYIKMSNLREELLKNNEKVNWKPGHLKYGRFGNFLNDVKDWALSRNRYWGTPLPVWRCEDGHIYMPESIEDLLNHADPSSVPDDFEPHRPWVDEIEVKCPVCGKPMKREPYLIDVWFDSGSAFFAQFHYPYENRDEFKKSYPVDFITEALDQTRGWFYTLMAISTAVFGDAPYRNVLTLGLILDEDGEKMSKSKGNAVDPMQIMESVGADAVRFYFYSTPVWKSRRFSENLVREYAQKTLMTLWNVYVFFKNNAELDGFNPDKIGKVSFELDRWLISRLNSTIGEVRKSLDSLEIHKATKALERFIDELSNWYLRRSRRRFWKEEMGEDKISAYTALYNTLKSISRVMAPFTPFFADFMYKNLWGEKESVHLEPYPEVDPRALDLKLEEEMNIAIKVAEAGRRARQLSNIKLRQPLASMTVVADEKYGNVVRKFREVLMEEVNVKDVRILSSAEGMVNVEIRPNYRVLGPKLKGDMKKVIASLKSMPVEDVVRKIKGGGIEIMGYLLTSEDVEIVEKPTEGILAVEVEGLPMAVYLDTHVTRELRLEGLAREVVRRIQSMRKDMDLEYAQKIRTFYVADGELKDAIEMHRDYIMRETQSTSLEEGEVEGYRKDWKIEGMKITLTILP